MISIIIFYYDNIMEEILLILKLKEDEDIITKNDIKNLLFSYFSSKIKKISHYKLYKIEQLDNDLTLSEITNNWKKDKDKYIKDENWYNTNMTLYIKNKKLKF
jgi:hypothetical protein